jgi:hypothetical protein
MRVLAFEPLETEAVLVARLAVLDASERPRLS